MVFPSQIGRGGGRDCAVLRRDDSLAMEMVFQKPAETRLPSGTIVGRPELVQYVQVNQTVPFNRSWSSLGLPGTFRGRILGVARCPRWMVDVPEVVIQPVDQDRGRRLGRYCRPGIQSL